MSRRLPAVYSLVLLLSLNSGLLARANRDQPSTAWRNNRFNMDVASIVSRSDIVLQRPNRKPDEAMPLGNGRLGLAVWSAGGLTIQLNRADTLPGRLSPGQVVLPGLERLASASNYSGRLDLYRGEFAERGGGLTATVYVHPDLDMAVVEVAGADPNSQQSATLLLWQPRRPEAFSHEGIAVLSETWKDSTEAGASGETFGTLAAITADAREVQAKPDGPVAVKLSFRPKADGSFRLLIAAPEWKGGDAMKRSAEMFAAKTSVVEHRHRWADLWNHTGLMKLSSQDGSAEYFENLRCIDLFTAAAESLGRFPGSQAGIGDLFSSIRDEHKWGPSAYWHWNLRMQVAANLGAGLYHLNDSYFNLYRDNLQNIETWTKEQMNNRPGACVPETMRFNGKGYENETWLASPGLNCNAGSKPYYNARTLSTGAEVSLWVWQQYLATQDRAFLASNYPLMAASARFLLAYATRGSDGTVHTYPSNAHETQWDVHDPTTDIAVMRALFPVVVQAARILNLDAHLAEGLEAAIPHILPLPHASATSRSNEVSRSGDAASTDVIAQSYDADAPTHNTENIGLEPVWPYSLIGDDGPLHDLAVRTYAHRPNKFKDDWSFDPIQAARLGLSSELKSAVLELTQTYQEYPSGFAKFVGSEFYVEQIGVVAAALQEAMVQDYDGLVRIAPSWPKEWDADGTVYIQQRSKVNLQIRDGLPVTVAIEAGANGRIHVRDPWLGKPVEVVSDRGKPIITQTDGADPILDIPVEAGHSYVVQPIGVPNATLPFSAVDGTPAARPKSLGTRHIGLLQSGVNTQ